MFEKDKLVIVRSLRWYHRLWHTILTWMGRECYAGKLEPSRYHDQQYQLLVNRMWLCPGCGRYVDWDHGCAHEDPKLARLCDDCFCAHRRERPSR